MAKTFLDKIVSQRLPLAMTYQTSGTDGVMDIAVYVALADPTRQSMLQLLRSRPQCVGELARLLPVSRPAVSQHLKVLRKAQLVREYRHGTRHYFSLNPVAFGELRQYADSMWQDALNAFAAYVSAQKKSPTKDK
jgi:DNA-binding transcriptional ArsR family regulator